MNGGGKTLGLAGRARGARVRHHPVRTMSRSQVRERRTPRWVEQAAAQAGSWRSESLGDVVVHVGWIRGSVAGRPGAIAHLSAAALSGMNSMRATEPRQMCQLGGDSGGGEQRSVLLRCCT
eukprot:6213063-Pleurochrysis_carterae.AAC.1